MKKLFLISFLSIFVFANSAQANDPQIINATPEFADVIRIYNEMTPEQKAQVLENAKNVQAELEQMTPTERQQYFKRAKEGVKNIDFSKVDAKKLDTSKNVTLEQIDQYFESAQKKKN